MAYDKDSSADELGRALADLIQGVQIAPGALSLLDAVSTEFAARSARRSDRMGEFDHSFPEPPAARAPADGTAHDQSPPPHRGASATHDSRFPWVQEDDEELDASFDARSLWARLGASLISVLGDTGLVVQAFWSRQVPRITRLLEELQGPDEPLPEHRRAVVNELHHLIRELGALAREQGCHLQREIERLAGELLPPEHRPRSPTDLGLWRAGRIKADRPADVTPDSLGGVGTATANEEACLEWPGAAGESRKVEGHEKMPADLVDEYMRLHGPAIDRLEKAITGWIHGADPNVQPMLEHQFQTESAKYFRAKTIFSAWRAHCHDTVEVPDWLITVAQVVEMVHNATLIIDDIVDRSPARRGGPTLHIVYDELRAYMVAGYIIADGYEILAREMVHAHDAPVDRRVDGVEKRGTDIEFQSTTFDSEYFLGSGAIHRLDWLPDARFNISLLSELLKRLAVAECVQWVNRGNNRLHVEDWRYLAREDTGSMFEICACLGGRTNRLRRFGRLLGMLYHGCDDVADLKEAIEEERRENSSLGGGGDQDVKDSILTLPAALAIEADPEGIGADFRAPVDDSRRSQRLAQWLDARVEFARESKGWWSEEQLLKMRRDFKAVIPQNAAEDRDAEADRIKRLTEAFGEQLGNAEKELNRIMCEALRELHLHRAHLPGVDFLVAMVYYTRRLSGPPLAAA